MGAIGAALYSIGIPKDSVVKYETALQADRFLVMAHGTSEEVSRARDILHTASPLSLDVHNGLSPHDVSEPAGAVHA
jgi:hypothetical protein